MLEIMRIDVYILHTPKGLQRCYMCCSIFFYPLSMGRFDEIRTSVGISSLVLRNDFSHCMNNWLLKGNKEISNPLKFRI
jgi:hypothetical protein